MNARRQKIIDATVQYIQTVMQSEASGHDWWHIYRVWQMAKHLAEQEQADSFIVEMAALLHDLEDWKLSLQKPMGIAEWLEHQGVDDIIKQKIITVIEQVSFKGAGVKDQMTSLEAKVVQDADRLDAIGAIGIGRAFAYGGHKNRSMYEPNVPPEVHHSYEAYKKNQTHTINHFYEKLLLLKDRMHTPSAKTIAEHRHRFMEQFLHEFLNEWTVTKT